MKAGEQRLTCEVQLAADEVFHVTHEWPHVIRVIRILHVPTHILLLGARLLQVQQKHLLHWLWPDGCACLLTWNV